MIGSSTPSISVIRLLKFIGSPVDEIPEGPNLYGR